MNKLDRWELEKKIDKIIDENCKEIPWEGTEVDKGQLKQDIMNLIEYLTKTELEEGSWLG